MSWCSCGCCNEPHTLSDLMNVNRLSCSTGDRSPKWPGGAVLPAGGPGGESVSLRFPASRGCPLSSARGLSSPNLCGHCHVPLSGPLRLSHSDSCHSVRSTCPIQDPLLVSRPLIQPHLQSPFFRARGHSHGFERLGQGPLWKGIIAPATATAGLASWLGPRWKSGGGTRHAV